MIDTRSPVIENHNIDYDYVNILLNDVGERHYYQGYNYGRGGLAESHCPNTFLCFAPDGSYTIIKNENGQSVEMQEMDKFLNSYTRSIPTDKEKTESTELLGYLIERAFNLKNNGDIGIFFLNGRAYIKKFHMDETGISLLSLNPAYDPIPISEAANFMIYGKVV